MIHASNVEATRITETDTTGVVIVFRTGDVGHEIRYTVDYRDGDDTAYATLDDGDLDRFFTAADVNIGRRERGDVSLYLMSIAEGRHD